MQMTAEVSVLLTVIVVIGIAVFVAAYLFFNSRWSGN